MAKTGTPFISLLEPSKLEGYDRSKPHDQQKASIPRAFMDAMEVREEVFVREQGVPLEFEHDKDDAKSLHWVIYTSVNRIIDHEIKDPKTGAVIQPKRSETRSVPIGTLRCVPFPHPPHPQPGGRYVDNVLQNEEVNTLDAKQMARRTSSLPYGHDAPTSLHDGQEPYMKLGRLAVLKPYRKMNVGAQLWAAARQYLIEHPDYYNPSVTKLGLDALDAHGVNDIPRWKGLVCVHAQDGVKDVWARWGFQVDDLMGEWWEEGIRHVGMFQRLPLPPRQIQIDARGPPPLRLA
ncbi:ribosomal protein S5 [Pestalotiopsis sp. IQ-011]